VRFRTSISALLLSLIPSSAFAYLDPGTTSIVINFIIAGIVGAAVSVKIYWNMVSAWLMKTFSSRKFEDDL
jgi:hypothetical protein